MIRTRTNSHPGNIFVDRRIEIGDRIDIMLFSSLAALVGRGERGLIATKVTELKDFR